MTRLRGLHSQILLTASDLCIRWMQVSYCSPAYGLSSSHSAVDGFFVVDCRELSMLPGAYSVWGC